LPARQSTVKDVSLVSVFSVPRIARTPKVIGSGCYPIRSDEGYSRRLQKHKGDWQVYESEFMNLMAKRGIESKVPRELLENACLLCSEATPENCHRRLVVEYLQPFWGPMTMNHLIPSEWENGSGA